MDTMCISFFLVLPRLAHVPTGHAMHDSDNNIFSLRVAVMHIVACLLLPTLRRDNCSACRGCERTQKATTATVRPVTECSYLQRADQDGDYPSRLGQGYRSICGGLRAFLRFQVLSALPAVSLIIPTQATTVVWTRLTGLHGNATFLPLCCVQKRCRRIDASSMLCNRPLRAAGIVCKQRAHLAVEIEESKPRPLSVLMPLTARSLGEAA